MSEHKFRAYLLKSSDDGTCTICGKRESEHHATTTSSDASELAKKAFWFAFENYNASGGHNIQKAWEEFCRANKETEQ